MCFTSGSACYSGSYWILSEVQMFIFWTETGNSGIYICQVYFHSHMKGLMSVTFRPAVATLICCAPHGFGSVVLPIPISAVHQSSYALDSHIISTSEGWPSAYTVYVCINKQTQIVRFLQFLFYIKKTLYPQLTLMPLKQCRGHGVTFAD